MGITSSVIIQLPGMELLAESWLLPQEHDSGAQWGWQKCTDLGGAANAATPTVGWGLHAPQSAEQPCRALGAWAAGKGLSQTHSRVSDVQQGHGPQKGEGSEIQAWSGKQLSKESDD